MPAPLVVTIPHQLGAAEARRRIETGLERLRGQFSAHLSTAEVQWTGNHADVRVVAMAQTVNAGIDIGDDAVRVEFVLPWLLARLAERARGFLTKAGTDMLSLPPPKT
jgi:hypothetical protein